MHAEWTDLMSAHLDGHLDLAASRRLEAHLRVCAECEAVLADLRRLVAAAPNYQGDAPAADLWPAIQRQLGPGKVLAFPRRAAARFGLRALMAAGLVMAAAGAGGSWYWTHRGPGPVVAQETPVPGLSLTSSAYDSALTELGQTLESRRGQLDTATVRVLEQSIRTIDHAVAEARAAIQRDTANGYLNEQIAGNLRKKLNLLKAATRATNSTT